MRTFLDSSAWAKRYVEEPGSEAVDAVCTTATEVALSVVTVPEVVSALNRRVREGSLSRRQYVQAKERLSEDVRDCVIVRLTPAVIAACIDLLEASPLRTLDAIHLACAVIWESEVIVTADKRQLLAARKAGFRTHFV